MFLLRSMKLTNEHDFVHFEMTVWPKVGQDLANIPPAVPSPLMDAAGQH